MKNLQKQFRVTPRDSRSFDLYLRDIARLPLLSIDEEVSLARRIHAGD
jgi:DNA-directed RNA polymerase sigma subunit (sigma70/sigma32)